MRRFPCALKLPAGAAPWPHVIAAFLLVCFTVRLERKAFASMTSEDANEEVTVGLIDSVGHDDRYTLAGPHWICMSYAYRHDSVY